MLFEFDVILFQKKFKTKKRKKMKSANFLRQLTSLCVEFFKIQLQLENVQDIRDV